MSNCQLPQKQIVEVSPVIWDTVNILYPCHVDQCLCLWEFYYRSESLLNCSNEFSLLRHRVQDMIFILYKCIIAWNKDNYKKIFRMCLFFCEGFETALCEWISWM